MIKRVRRYASNYQRVIIASLLLLGLIASCLSNSFVKADSSVVITFPSLTYENTLVYFSKFSGDVIHFDLENTTSRTTLSLPGVEPAFQEMINNPSSVNDPLDYIPDTMLVSPTHSHILFRSPNTNRFGSPMYSTDSNESNLWWLYADLNSEFHKLSEKFTAVGWYSSTEILYVFDNREIAVAPITNLNDFRVLSDNIPQPVDITRSIIANSERQLIPLQGGYYLGQNGEFRFIETNGTIEALPSHDLLVSYTDTEADILTWNGEIVAQVTNLRPIAKALAINSDEILFHLQDGTLLRYHYTSGNYLNVPEVSGEINEIYYANQNTPSEILMIQEESVFVYDTQEGERISVVFDDSNNPIPPQDQTEPTMINFGMIALIIASIFIFGTAAWLFIRYKRARSAY